MSAAARRRRRPRPLTIRAPRVSLENKVKHAVVKHGGSGRALLMRLRAGSRLRSASGCNTGTRVVGTRPAIMSECDDLR